MPSSQTRLRQLDRKIRELQEQEQLSDANLVHLRYLQLWREFGMKDVVLVIQPKGAINRGETPPATIKEVTDMCAADMLAYSGQRNQRVRLATEEEIAQYRAYMEAKRVHQTAETAKQQAELARANLASMLGLATGTVVTGPTAAPPVAPAVSAARADESEEEPLVPVLPAVGGGQVVSGAAAGPAGDKARGLPLEALEVTTALSDALCEAGYMSVEQVAAADPAELAKKVHGVGRARGAELVTRASELLAARSAGAAA